MGDVVNTKSSVKREVVAFVGIAYALASTVALALPDADINLLLSVLVPTATVTILTFTITPRGARREIWRSLGLGRAGLRVWPAAIALPLLLCAGAYGAAVLIGAGRFEIDLADATPSWAINLALSALIGTVLILGEEIGWRGYLLPRMQQLIGDKRRAAVWTGFVHGCFHLPLILLATTYDTEGSRWVAAPMAVAVITAGGVFYAWVRDRAGTVWPVAVAHNTVNTVFDQGSTAMVATSGSSVAYVAGETGSATLIMVLVLAIVLLQRAKVWRTSGQTAQSGRPAPSAAA
jgi:membrane protease YdiL (CAAX protease family)